MTRGAVLLVALVCGTFGPPALAAEEPPTAEQWQRAVDGAKLLLEEDKKFDSSHSLKGQVAEPAVRQMQDEGYACDIGYLSVPRLEADGVTPRMVRAPFVFCNQPSPGPDDACKERRVSLRIAWPDRQAPAAELRAQLSSSRIVDRTFRCVPADWVLRGREAPTPPRAGGV